MGFNVENIPYLLTLGLDLENIDPNQIFDYITKLQELKIDYLVTNISVPDKETRKQALKDFSSPIFVDDYSLFAHEWKQKFVAKLHKDDFIDLENNFDIIYQDLEYSNHVSSRFMIFHYSEQLFLMSKMIRKFLLTNPERQINFIIDFTEEGLVKWKKLYSQLGYLENIGLILRFQADLPGDVRIRYNSFYRIYSVNLQCLI